VIPPEWWARDDRQPGSRITPAAPHSALVRVVDMSRAVPCHPRARFATYVILPVLAVAVILVMVIAYRTGVL
jgi:hypothetical protein